MGKEHYVGRRREWAEFSFYVLPSDRGVGGRRGEYGVPSIQEPIL